MKLIVAGATGFVATEVIRQALSNTAITSVVALARRQAAVPDPLGPKADIKKFKPVVCDDFHNYSESVKRELDGANAVIWLMAITPSKSKDHTWDEVYKVCHEYTVTGLETIPKHGAENAGPLRFVYTSGSNAERDPAKKPPILGEYSVMRGGVELAVLKYAEQSQGRMEGIVTKPGIINKTTAEMVATTTRTVGTTTITLPVIRVDQMAAALLCLALQGSEKDTLSNADLTALSQTSLGQEQMSYSHQ